MRRKLLIGLAVVVVGATAGGAYAATQTNSNPRQAFLNDVAKRLGVSPDKLRAAVNGAFLDRLNAAVAAGRLTQAQANRLKQRLEHGRGLPFGPGLMLRFRLRGHRGGLDAAATYLGVSQAQLLGDLRGGQTLAQVAKAHGKSVAGLEQALINEAKTKLDHLVSAGRLTTAQEQRIESRLTTRIDRLVNRALPRFGSGVGPRFFPGSPPPGAGGPGGPPPGAPGPGGPALGAPAPVPPPAA